MDTTNENLKHHVRQSYCHSRLKYREGKQLTAVKVSTVVVMAIVDLFTNIYLLY